MCVVGRSSCVGALLSAHGGSSAMSATATSAQLPRHLEGASVRDTASAVHSAPLPAADSLTHLSTPKRKKSVSFIAPSIATTSEETASLNVDPPKLVPWEYACDFDHVANAHKLNASVLTPSGSFCAAQLFQLSQSCWRLAFVASEIGTHQCMLCDELMIPVDVPTRRLNVDVRRHSQPPYHHAGPACCSQAALSRT
jgi:hypothetical protein